MERRSTFDEESKALYDAVAPTHTDSEFDAVLKDLESRLPGQGSLSERFDKFRSRFTIPKDRLDATFKAAIEGCRSRTLAHLSLPAGESFVVEYVTNKSWSGYNWYKGNYHSVIQVNTDLPIFADRAIDLACHEGYPGHHVYNVLLEKTLVRDRGWVEFSVYPLRSPQSLIAEGSANYGIDIAFPRAERLQFERSVIFPDGRSRLQRRVDDYYAVLSLVDRSVVRGQRGRAPLSQWADRRGSRCRVARAIRTVFAAARAAADAVHRPVPQLRDQLQRGQRHGGALCRVAVERWRRRCASLGCLHATLVVSAASIRVDPMICIEISRPGGPEVLVPVERPDPVPGPDEVLIRVAGSGVNRPDVLQRRVPIRLQRARATSLASKSSGTIAAVGSGRQHWRVDDRVCALVAGGGYATMCVAPARQCLPVSTTLDLVEAGAIPETFFTVWTNVFDRGRLRAGETALFHGGSSGIGTTAIQLAAARGVTVLATAGSDEKCRACEELGAKQAINYRTADFVKAVLELTDGKGVDLILDMVGGSYIGRNLEALATDGRLVQIGFMSGESTAPVDFRRILTRRLTITGSTLRPRTSRRRGRSRPRCEREIWPLLDRGARQADHPSHVSAGQGRRSAPPDGVERAYRQDRARSIIAAALRRTSSHGL